jgi:hypothetical protein
MSTSTATRALTGAIQLAAHDAFGRRAAANRQVVAVMRERLAAGEQVARMY